MATSITSSASSENGESTVAQPPCDRLLSRAYLLLAVVWLISSLYMGIYLNRGWHAHDDGTLAQSAERVMLGELPHRDFDELYTGGLDYVNAAAFRIFGTNLLSMRYPLYVAFLVWVPTLFFIARRFSSAWIAAATTLLAIAWSVPNYSTPMPSWYNLFFATFGLAALFRYVEGKCNGWLFVAGLCGGISFLFKLSGLYYVAGAILFLMLPTRTTDDVSARGRPRSGLIIAIPGAIGCVACVFAVLRKPFHAGSFLYFFIPVLAVASAVLWFWRRGDAVSDFSNLIKSLFVFGIGVAIPILFFLSVYFKAGALADFVRGVFVLPGKRLLFTVRTQSLARFIVGTVVDAFAILLLFKSGRVLRGILTAALAVVALGIIVLARSHAAVYDAVWVAIWNLLPVVVAAGLITISRIPGEIDAVRKKAFLLLATTAICSLIQFPYSAPIYFCYVAPLLILSIPALLSLRRTIPAAPVATLYCSALVYAVLVLSPTFLANRGELFFPDRGASRVDLPRIGGLRLYGNDAHENSELVGLILQHAHGEYIFATPDCPQVYFLSGFRNPTRTLFDFLDDPVGRIERIVSAIHARKVNLVVINRSPGFSGPVASELLQRLQGEFPKEAQTANYDVRWKEAQ